MDTVSPNTTPPLLLSVREAARQLGLSRTTLYELFADGTLRACKIGKRRLVSQAAVRELVARAEAAGSEAA